MQTRITAVMSIVVLFSAMGAVAQPLVVVDPGHGGHDSGAVGCGLHEADVVLDVGLQLAARLEAAGIRAQMTRSDDRFIELQARAAYANERNAALFVAIHANSNDGAAGTGSETWISNGAGAVTEQFAGRLQRAMVAEWGMRDRGVKRANFTVLTATAMSAALCETGFINNCGIDAPLLGDAGARARLGGALMEAVAEQLGVDPVDPPDPPDETGVATGVVFEDVGVGTDDMTIRLAGATVRVIETGDETHAQPESARWSFDLDPGDYTIEARMAGFETARRDCSVVAGGEAWCSIGLFPAGGPEPDTNVPPRADAAPPRPDAAGPRSDAGAPQADANPQPADAGLRRDAWQSADASRWPDAQRPNADARMLTWDAAGSGDAYAFERRASAKKDEGCNCRVGASGRSGAWWVVAVLGLLWIRRRPAWLALLLMVFGLTGPARAQSSPTPRIATERVLAEGRFHTPRISPNGRHVAVGEEGGRRLKLIPVDGTAARILVDSKRAGHRPVWLADSQTIAYRSPEQTGTAVPALACRLDGTGVTPALMRPDLHVFVVDDSARLRQLGVERTIRLPNDRVITAETSSDGRWVVLWGLHTGLTLYHVSTERLVPLGRGGHPTFGPHSRWLVFEQTEDDGAKLVAGDIWRVDLHQSNLIPVRVTYTPNRIETEPSVDAQGNLVFVAGDALIYARLILGP